MRVYKHRDLTGQKFGRLAVLGFSKNVLFPSGKKKFVWKVKCDCGVEKEVVGESMKSGTTKSCGCLKQEVSMICKKPKGGVGLRSLYAGYKCKAKLRKLDFFLSEDDVKNITSCNCHYCGEPPSSISKTGSNKSDKTIKHSEYIYNGIDRVDNDKGYLNTNCVTACKDCNRAKMDRSYDEFLEWNKRVNKHLKLGETEEQQEMNLMLEEAGY